MTDCESVGTSIASLTSEGAKVEIEVEKPDCAGSPGRPDALADAVIGRIAGEADPDFTGQMRQVGVRTLGLGDHVGPPLEQPGRDETAEAPASRRLLELEVAIDVVECCDHRPGLVALAALPPG